MATTTANSYTRVPQHQPEGPCCCPSCVGLQCLERPRFFAGQRLTDLDLNSLENYVLSKNRLHNRFLHGPGVVCGLEVVCHDCEGTVEVRPGYAIDPCGNDIVLCESAIFDVQAAIDECCQSRRKKRPCDPYQQYVDSGCKGVEERWCITIQYVEREARGQMPLRNSCSCGASTGGSCSCGGNKSAKSSGGCGCSKGKSKSSGGAGTCSCCSAPPVRRPSPSECEPTRILETYKLCVVEESQACLPKDPKHPSGVIGATLDCLQSLRSFISPQLAPLLLKFSNNTINDQELYQLCCLLRQLLEGWQASHFATHCITLPGCAQPDPAGQGGNRAQLTASINTMVKQLARITLDCLCYALLPKCSSDPCDDRLILACVTIRDGRIIDICNYSCRSFAGNFPALKYWFGFLADSSLEVITRICCATTREAGVAFLNNGIATNAAYAGGFTTPGLDIANPDTLSQVIFNLQSVTSGLSLEQLTPLFNPAALPLSSMIGQSPGQAQERLKAAGIESTVRQVATTDDVPASGNLFDNVLALPGQRVIIYQARDQVAGIAIYDDRAALRDSTDRIAQLERDVEMLKASIRQ